MKYKVVEVKPYSLAMPNEPVYLNEFGAEDMAWEDAIDRMRGFIQHHGGGCCRVQYEAGVESAKAEEAYALKSCKANHEAEEERLANERRIALNRVEHGSAEYWDLLKKYASMFDSLDRTRETVETEAKARYNGMKHSWGVEYVSDLKGFVDKVRADMRKHGTGYAKFNMIVNRRLSRADGPQKDLVVVSRGVTDD